MNLYEIAVILKTKDQDDTLLVPPTPVMAADEKAAEYLGVLLASAKNTADTLDPSRIKVLVRPFI